MVARLRAYRDWIANLDRKAWLTFALATAALAVMSLLFWVSAQLIGWDANGPLSNLFQTFANSWWALPVVVLAFVGASFIGAPQFVLIAVTVAAFGPLKGFLFAWLATLTSASCNFLLARYLGGRWLRRIGLDRLDGLLTAVGRNGFLASMLVRIVPSGPFIVVNSALGLTHASFVAFLAGTAIGTIPKTALVALLGEVVERALAGDLAAINYLCGAVGLWLALAYAAKRGLEAHDLRKSAAPGNTGNTHAPQPPTNS
ncbi:MAG: VTT domain-containing protein [Planctomycetota bacterium]